ncbi:SDR family NAD(P)-dependent oxidoreductase [Sphingomonas bacterium]|uniref:SDR family NAD(P)-dependent oxidoreductase n=1 Tax=Sphingomonas bacterium TaxID=1895847 RepID=UPI0015759DF8|nr:SDR family oxidoreductase [Sphingomonas bacterium]
MQGGQDRGGAKMAGRRVIVTGAASGIGRATALLFHQEGARLALIDRDKKALLDIAAPIGAHAFPVDLADTFALDPVVAAAAAAMGGIDGIVNCAAFSKGGPIETMDPDVLGRFVAVNLVAPYLLCRAALPHMRQCADATIVNIASGQALLPNAPNNTAYAATKGGLVAFSKALAAEVAPAVRVNALCPGVTNTPMAAHLFADYPNPSDAPFVKQYALQRIAEPIEIARAILFLSCNDSSYVTGIAMAVDGGRTYH